MLTTIHSCSGLGLKDDQELFQIPATQFSHEGHHFQEFQPLSADYQNSDSIQFKIRNTAEHYIDPSSIFIHVRGKVVRHDGKEIVSIGSEVKADTPHDQRPDKVYPCDNFANSLFAVCNVFLNDKRITSHELYTY